jgi:hypothetical protein
VQGYRVLNERNANDNTQDPEPTTKTDDQLNRKPRLSIDCDKANQENYDVYFARPQKK